jgi:hypothetical protein
VAELRFASGVKFIRHRWVPRHESVVAVRPADTTLKGICPFDGFELSGLAPLGGSLSRATIMLAETGKTSSTVCLIGFSPSTQLTQCDRFLDRLRNPADKSCSQSGRQSV